MKISSAIRARNKERKALKQATSSGPWSYDSWAFVHQSESIPRSRRFGILVRPMGWFDTIWDRFDNDFLDKGMPRSRRLFEQGYHDADYIAKARNDRVEEDIDLLIAEVIRLRKL